MSVDTDQLTVAVKRNDAAAVRDMLRDATEADRRACAKALRPLLRGPELVLPEPMIMFADPESRELLFARITCRGHDHEELSAAQLEYDAWNEMRHGAAFLAAALGLAGGVAVAVKAADDDYHDYDPSEADLDAVAGVLADRRPEWLAEFVSRRLEASFSFGFDPWLLARRLVRLGTIPRPEVPGYITRFPEHMWHVDCDDYGDCRLTDTVADALLADPGLLEDEVWRLFTVPDVARELQRFDTDRTMGQDGLPFPGCWSDSLAVLSEDGHLDRDRLIDATLDAFTRDFAPNRVAWYATFHDRLCPSLAEMAARADRYLGLLAVSSKPGVALGQRGCGLLLGAGLLPAEQFLAASAPALLFPQKAVATAQLKLVGKVAARQPEVRALAVATAAQAFGHQREDIQEAALRLIARHGVPDGPERAIISELAASMSPALARDATILGLPASCPPALRAADRDAEVPGPATAEPSAGRALPPPLEDPEELIQLLTQLMEDASDPVAVERAMAGAVRLASLPAADRARLAAPLLRRAEERAGEDFRGPFSGHEITADIARLALAWGAGWSVRDAPDRDYWGREDRQAVWPSGEARQMAGILSARVREAAGLIGSGRPVRLLADPETERGAVSPGRLLQRLACWSGASAARIPRHDLEIALLRLAPSVDESFWSEWAQVHATSARTARRLYQEGIVPLSLEPVIGQAPGRYRDDPPGDLLVLARVSPPSAGAAEGSRCWRLLTDLASPLRNYRRDYGETWERPHYEAVVAGWPLLCPWQPDLAAAHLLRPLSDGLKAKPSAATTAAWSLASPGFSLGPIANLALTAGLASAAADTRIAAAEAWSRACLDGRLHPELAAAAIVTGVTSGAFKLNRIADGLQHASPEPLVGYRIIETLCAAADELIPAGPANLHQLFDLAARIAAATGTPVLPGAITGLAAQRSGSRLVAAARRLTASGDGPGPARDQVIAQALAALTAQP